jgi:hypothetical protein
MKNLRKKIKVGFNKDRFAICFLTEHVYKTKNVKDDETGNKCEVKFCSVCGKIGHVKEKELVK